jgi:hypothetical protein
MPMTLAQRLRQWCRGLNREEGFLAAATDLADLERRMRTLERGAHNRPLFVTFNH